MNIDRRIVPLVLGLSAAGVSPSPLLAQVSSPAIHAAPSSQTKLQSETTRLIRADAEKSRPKSASQTEEAPPPPPSAEGAVLLEPLTVWSGKQLPDFAPPRETTVAKFFRTGTIARQVGKKVTTRVWSSGDAGMVLTFSW